MKTENGIDKREAEKKAPEDCKFHFPTIDLLAGSPVSSGHASFRPCHISFGKILAWQNRWLCTDGLPRVVCVGVRVTPRDRH